MSMFGTGYQAGLNAALGEQISQQLWSALNQRRQQSQQQNQWNALQGQLQATLAQLHVAQLEITRLQQENGLLRQEHTELSRFSNWAMEEMDRMSECIEGQQSMIAVMLKD